VERVALDRGMMGGFVGCCAVLEWGGGGGDVGGRGKGGEGGFEGGEVGVLGGWAGVGFG